MSSLRSEPFLWIHLAGIAAFPICLAGVLLGLAIGNPTSFLTLELLTVGIIGIVPIFWMQIVRPFDIFSVLIFSLKPEKLTEDQRKILTLFKTQKHQWFSAIAALLMALTLWLLARLAPVGMNLVAEFPQWRILGLAIASSFFLAANLFLQIPLSVFLVLLSNKYNKTEPYETAKINRNFTLVGFRVDKILSFLR